MIKNFEYAISLHKQKKYDEAYAIFLELSNNNDANAQEMVANMLFHGSGIKQNKELAYSWYEKAAENNNPEAQYWYGQYKLKNDYISEGLSLIASAAENNYPEALRCLGIYYSDGKYIDKDIDKSILLLQKALFEYGHKDALPNLLYTLNIKHNKLRIFFILLGNIFKMIFKEIRNKKKIK